MRVYKGDFYYGALLSVLINNGISPYILETSDSRKIFELSTNSGKYKIYTKYVTSPKRGSNGKRLLWNFTFNKKEIEEIKRLLNNEGNLYFAFVCGQKEFETGNCEITLLSAEQLKECINIENPYGDQERLSIRKNKGAHSLSVYGSKKADKLNNEDNTIKISRDWIKAL